MASPNHQEHPVKDASSKQQTKQKYKPSHQQTGLPPHSALPIRGKTKNKQTNKNSAQISPYMKLIQTSGPTIGGKKSKGRQNSTLSLGKGDLKHNKLKKIMKKQKNTMKEQIRNTEVQINEEEIGKLPEKVFRIMIVSKDDQKP